MARPAMLCKLSTGKLIDSQAGFVETFNWMVDFINNLCGDKQNIKITNPTGTNPVVRFVGDAGGLKDLTVVDEEYGEQTATNLKTLRIESAGTSHITFLLTNDGEGNATLTVGVEYYDDSSSNSSSNSSSES